MVRLRLPRARFLLLWVGLAAPLGAGPLPELPPDPIEITPCTLEMAHKQEVPSAREGILLVLGTELKPGEGAPPDRLVTVQTTGRERRFRRLAEGDRVEKGQVLGLIDPARAWDVAVLKRARIQFALADLKATECIRDESHQRFLTAKQLRLRNTISEEELRAAKLTFDRYVNEVAAKQALVHEAESEEKLALAVVAEHEIHAALSGTVVMMLKRPGEAVKALEGVVQLQNTDLLQVSGVVDLAQLTRLRSGMAAQVFASVVEGPRLTMPAHPVAVSGVAFIDLPKRLLLASTSSEGGARLVDMATRKEIKSWGGRGQRSFLAVAPSREVYLFQADGGSSKFRVWDLSTGEPKMRTESPVESDRSVGAVALGPGGRTCVLVTYEGGANPHLEYWELGKPARRATIPFPAGSWINNLQFADGRRLVYSSPAGVCFLAMGEKGFSGSPSEAYNHRGAVGVSRDGERMLVVTGPGYAEARVTRFDRSEIEFVLREPDRLQLGSVCLFSPDGAWAVASNQRDGTLHLWRLSDAGRARHPIRSFVNPGRRPTHCAAFSPDGRLLVSGDEDGRLHFWNLPGPEEMEKPRAARLTMVPRAINAADQQGRIGAEVPNADGRLIAGTRVTLVVPVEEAKK